MGKAIKTRKMVGSCLLALICGLKLHGQQDTIHVKQERWAIQVDMLQPQGLWFSGVSKHSSGYFQVYSMSVEASYKLDVAGRSRLTLDLSRSRHAKVNFDLPPQYRDFDTFLMLPVHKEATALVGFRQQFARMRKTKPSSVLWWGELQLGISRSQIDTNFYLAGTGACFCETSVQPNLNIRTGLDFPLTHRVFFSPSVALWGRRLRDGWSAWGFIVPEFDIGVKL